jgi:hypothetical protein
MKIESPAFENDEFIPDKYTCNGKNINPQLNFSQIPPNTKSLALILEDPDAPGGIFTHWILWQMSSEVRTIDEDSLPTTARIGKNDFSKEDYGGPCPPKGDGTHRYMFRLYALDTADLTLSTTPTREDLLQAMTGHILEEAMLIGRYKRE